MYQKFWEDQAFFPNFPKILRYLEGAAAQQQREG
jgi:hypothetical protein